MTVKIDPLARGRSSTKPLSFFGNLWIISIRNQMAVCDRRRRRQLPGGLGLGPSKNRRWRRRPWSSKDWKLTRSSRSKSHLLWSVNSKITVSTTPKTLLFFFFEFIIRSHGASSASRNMATNKWYLSGKNKLCGGRCDSVNELRQKNGIWLTNDRINKKKTVKEVILWLDIFFWNGKKPFSFGTTGE